MNTPWRIEMLGWLRAVQGDRTVTRFRSRQTGGLLAYLAYHGHRSHPREQLIEILWPQIRPDTGRNRLSLALSSLRRQLEPPGIARGAVIVAGRDSVQLNPAAFTTDVMEFEAACAAGLPVTSQASPLASQTERLRRLEEAVQLCRGELLPGYLHRGPLPLPLPRLVIFPPFVSAVAAVAASGVGRVQVFSCVEARSGVVAITPRA
jgi:two-component SAPR family response regulator